MPTIQSFCDFFDAFAPLRLAEEWDNVGLLVGDRSSKVERVMTCLTVTPESACEAIEQKADLIVTHHPIPFRPLRRLTTDQTASRLLWELVRAGVAIYSPHTCFDSAKEGINQSLATALGLTEIQPLVPSVDDPDGLGSGRMGTVENQSLGKWATVVQGRMGLVGCHVVGDRDAPVSRVAIACGSGGSFLERAIEAGCDTLVTGETTFHTALEARANQVSLVLVGHYESERFAVELLVPRLQKAFPTVRVWASEKEDDPLVWMASGS